MTAGGPRDDDNDAVRATVRQQAEDPDASQPLSALEDQDVRDRRQDRQLREYYARYFIYLLIAQLLVMNLVMIGAGRGWLDFDAWTFRVYLSGTLAEVFGVVYVITSYLFPRRRG